MQAGEPPAGDSKGASISAPERRRGRRATDRRFSAVNRHAGAATGRRLPARQILEKRFWRRPSTSSSPKNMPYGRAHSPVASYSGR